MRRQKRIHERFEVGPPPLRQGVPNHPLVVDTFAGELIAHRRQALVETDLETLSFVVFCLEIIARPIIRCGPRSALVHRVSSKGYEGNGQFKERVGNLQHQDVRMVMLMADQYSFTRPSHAMQLVMLFQPLQSRYN